MENPSIKHHKTSTIAWFWKKNNTANWKVRLGMVHGLSSGKLTGCYSKWP
jgi:hypothetical protein